MRNKIKLLKNYANNHQANPTEDVKYDEIKGSLNREKLKMVRPHTIKAQSYRITQADISILAIYLYMKSKSEV